MARKTTGSSDYLLLECAWEVCNQVGGIYTVLRSKVPAMVEAYGDRYCLMGPAFHENMLMEFEEFPQPWTGPFGESAQRLADKGCCVHFGRWLVSGSPQVILMDPNCLNFRLNDLKRDLWYNHQIPTMGQESLIHPVIEFGELVRIYLQTLSQDLLPGFRRTEEGDMVDESGRVQEGAYPRILVHFHEWMSASALSDILADALPLRTVFTTHATLLGRYLSQKDAHFYENLGQYDPDQELRYYGIESQGVMERKAAQKADCFTTVSELTATECQAFFGREPEVILPNGLNIERFTALHEFQNLHKQYKMRIQDFVQAHFFPYYSFDLDKTLFFFVSGRMEFQNKGFDLALKSLSVLNQTLRSRGSDTTVVCFLITQKEHQGFQSEVLENMARLEDIRRTTREMLEVALDPFQQALMSRSQLPSLDEFVPEYWSLKMKRILQSWHRTDFPGVCTHRLQDPSRDDILRACTELSLRNGEDDRVKIIYHPEFVKPSNPLFSMEYYQFVRGCHLGIFPSRYEPWGYTPLECLAHGVPTITSDLSGFGRFVKKLKGAQGRNGVMVLDRQENDDEATTRQLVDFLEGFLKQDRRNRIEQRNRAENFSQDFDWKRLLSHYKEAYQRALQD